MTLFIPIVALSLVAFLSAVLCWGLIKVAPKDAPDAARKTQAQAVPTSGGIAIAVAALIPWVLFLSQNDYEETNGYETIIIPALRIFFENGGGIFMLMWGAVLLIGAIDDSRPLRARHKLVTLAMLSIFVSWFGKYVEGVFLPGFDSYVVLASWIGILGSALWLFIMMNATNFMDGSNGLSMGTLAIMIVGVGLHTFYEPLNPNGDPSAAYNQLLLTFFSGLVVAALLGFLFWNLQGKLYAGDAGSLFGGAVFASLGIYAAQDGNIWLPATLALPILVDVFMTLIWRARRGHNILTPHRHHAYQLVVKSGSGHMKTALIWWSFAGLCAWAALWAAGLSKSTSAGTFAVLLATGCAAWLVHRARTPAEFH